MILSTKYVLQPESEMRLYQGRIPIFMTCVSCQSGCKTTVVINITKCKYMSFTLVNIFGQIFFDSTSYCHFA